jgi:hypothetical protein
MQAVGGPTDYAAEAGRQRLAPKVAPILMSWNKEDLAVLPNVRLHCVPCTGTLFPVGIPTATEVQQRRHRGANSCYVLAALMAAARQYPAYLSCMVGVCGANTVQVSCYRNFSLACTSTESPERIQFTADVLSYKKFGRMRRLNTTGPALWPALCEKAYALCHGGARALTVPGHSVRPLQFFLGVEAYHAAILPQQDHLHGLAQLFLRGECLVLYDRSHHAHAVIGVRPARDVPLPSPCTPTRARATNSEMLQVPVARTATRWEVEVLDPRAPRWQHRRRSRWLAQPADLKQFVELACTQGAAGRHHAQDQCETDSRQRASLSLQTNRRHALCVGGTPSQI